MDKKTREAMTKKQEAVFDYIIDVPYDPHPMSKEWMLYELTPFKETVKIEVDILLNRNIDHWWHTYRNRDITLTTNVRDYTGKVIKSRYYRKVFDSNDLLNVYSGFGYFRFTQTMADFFRYAKEITLNWDDVIRHNLADEIFSYPQTDEVYALAAKMVGEEKCYQINSFPTFTHMKSKLNYDRTNLPWHKVLMYNIRDDFNIDIGGYRQQYPIHYFEKDWLTTEVIENYERKYGEFLRST